MKDPVINKPKPIGLWNAKAILLVRRRAEREHRSLSNSLTATVIEHLGENNPDKPIENADNRQ